MWRWSNGLQVWNLLEWTNLITKVDDGGRYSEEAHLCRIAEVIGLPSPDFVKRSEKLQNFFDSEGIHSKIVSMRATTDPIQANGKVALP